MIGVEPWVYADGAFQMTLTANAVSPDGRTVAVSAGDGTIYLWDLLTDQERWRIAHPGPVHELAFSPDGRTLAAASLAVPVLLFFTTHPSGWIFLPFLSLPLAVRYTQNLYTQTGPILNKTLGGTAQLVAIFAILFALGIVL